MGARGCKNQFRPGTGVWDPNLGRHLRHILQKARFWEDPVGADPNILVAASPREQQKTILTEDFHSKQQNIPEWRPRALPTCFPSLPEERFAALSCSKAAGKGLEMGFWVSGRGRNPAGKCLGAAQVSPGRFYLCLDEFPLEASPGWAGLGWHPQPPWSYSLALPPCQGHAKAPLGGQTPHPWLLG